MKTPKRLTPSIKKDYVHPSDYLNFDHRWSCEDCSHFKRKDELSGEACTIGYIISHHLKAQQIHDYELSGKMAFCRFHEID